MTHPAQLHREASDWFVKIHSADDPSPELIQEWLGWLKASDAHRCAFEDIARIWHSTTPALIAKERHVRGEPEYDGSIPIADWRQSLSRSAALAPRTRTRTRRIGVQWAIGVSAVAMLAAVAAFTLQKFDVGERPRISSGTFATRTGEHLDLHLADGSRVALGARSRLTVAFTPTMRQVRLDSGEAFFTVYKDRGRPFSVRALEGEVTAVGTAFDVRTLGNRVTVIVREGTVSVDDLVTGDSTAKGSGSPHIVRVAAGEQLIYGRDAHSLKHDEPRVTYIDPKESGRWREGWLIYRNETLKDVIADLSRYTDLRVDVDDTAGDLRFSGAVFKDRIPEWVVALPEVSPVAVEKEDNHLVVRLRGKAILADH
jgi:transmembrane sensor